jgi:cytoskeleton protein RodZ
MTTEQRVGAAGHAPAATAPGTQLRAAREAAGMSLDQVAQQLKLAPRQVKALEDQDFAHLPGRTFTRGFVRNYARLLNLDASGLLARLPDAAEAPALEAPTLQSTGAMIAELPSAEARGPGFARWLIPLVLVGCVVAAAGYEWYRGGLATPGESPLVPAVKSEPGDQAGTAPASTTSVALPNPLDTAPKPEPSGAPASPPGESAAAPATSAPVPATSPSEPVASAPAPAPSTAAPPATESAPPVAEVARAASSVAPAPLLLTYHGSSWTQVRDRNGQLLISRTFPAGSEQPVRGDAPFDIIIGNASAVTLLYHGTAVDLARFTNRNVARLRLS